VTVEFLNFQMERGNDLITPRPEPLPRPEARRPLVRVRAALARGLRAGCAPPVVLESTHARALEYVLMEWLRENAIQPVGPRARIALG
jgi:uncharacterized protein